ncbi:MAG: tRNA pseudouridine(38-40) synthase TruA [Lachnospiraceae bacterium]|nr:tRNA pseudouridine(38-40) synthase TruA [Lachnospiraceae bacterium]
MKKRVLLIISYEGTAYGGFARQKNAKTITGELEDALASATGEEILLIGGSRTDAGVHAMGNVAVFDTESPVPGDRFAPALNRRLPADIRVLRSFEVSLDFHPLHEASVKTYAYRILQTPCQDPLRRNFTWHIHRPLNLNAMKEAAVFLQGEHDFTSFCAAGSQTKTKVRTLYSVEAYSKEDEIVLEVRGNGFLYNMVRIITGTLVQVGFGRTSPEALPGILDAKDRSKAGPTAPPQGLTLLKYEFASIQNSADFLKQI